MSTIEPAEPRLVLPGKALPAGEGATWIGRGWDLFKKAPLIWVVIMVMMVVLSIVLSFAGWSGTIINQLISPVLGAGLMKGCQSLERGGELEIEHLFAGFTGPRLVPLLILGAIFIAAYGALFLLFVLFAGASALTALGALASFDINDPAALLSTGLTVFLPILLVALVVIALAVPVMAAYWFAPALVMLNGLSPMQAAKESFAACMRNFLAFLVYGLILLGLSIIAMIPLFLGFLVLVPVIITSTYAAYRQIFTEDAPAA